MSLYVNLAHNKTHGCCSLAFENKQYDMESLPSMLINRYANVDGDFNANLYLFVAELLTKNGYRYYVELFHEYAVKSYHLGILGLVSFCCYDVSIMEKSLVKKMSLLIEKLDYALLKINPGVSFEYSLTDAQIALSVFNGFSEQIDSFCKMFDLVVDFIFSDVAQEEEIFKNVGSFLDEESAYMTEKRDYLNKKLSASKSGISKIRDYVNTAVKYYVDIIENYSKYGAARIIGVIFDSFYDRPTAQVYERLRHSLSKSDKSVAKIANELSSQRIYEIERLLYEPKDSYLPPVDPYNPKRKPDPTAGWFGVDLTGDRWLVFATEFSEDKLPVITVAREGDKVTWWQQCGRWGQWVYTYCPGDGVVNKWEIRAKSYSVADRGYIYEAVRIWHAFIGNTPKALDAIESYLIIEKKEGGILLYPNDLRYTVLEKREMIPELLKNAPSKVLRRLKKWIR